MNPEQNKNIAIKWLEAFNQHNLKKLLSLYNDNAEHYSPKLKIRHPETQGLIKGKEALKTWWEDAFNRLPSLHYEIIKLTADAEQVFMEYFRHVENEEDLRVGEVLVIKNDLIIFSRVYHG
jgi:limonene-1,2-epoxide hydrolase